MEVIITAKATLMEGQTLADVVDIDILGCENPEIINIQTPKLASERKNKLLEMIIEHLCNYTGTSKKDIISKHRRRDKVDLRFSAAYLLYNTGLYSLGEIGEYMGGRDHTTIIHAIKQAKNRIQTGDSKFSPFKQAILKVEKLYKQTTRIK